MRSHADATVTIQTSAESVLSPPSWFGEVVLLARYLKQQGVLEAINERVRFVRRRFGRDAGDRFSRGPLRLRHQRGTPASSLLPETETLRRPLHGLVWA